MPEPLGFGGYVTSVPALPCLAAPGGRQRILLAGGGGVASTLPRLWGRTRSGPGASARCRVRLFADGVPPAPGGGPSLSVPPATGPVGPSSVVDARHVPRHSSAAPPYPQLHTMHIVCVGVPRRPKVGAAVASA